jgi:type II secretory pathway pseudopilin PulG
MLMHVRNQHRGFTLFQLLVVLALLLLLFALFFPAVVKVRQAAARSQCSNNLRQICLGTINCADTYRGKLPPAVGNFPVEGQGNGPLFFHILPFIEQDNVYKSAAETVGGKTAYNVWHGRVASTHIRTYLCPQDISQPERQLFQGWLATSSYAGNFLVFGNPNAGDGGGSLQGESRFPASITDGTSNTIFFAERYQRCGEDACAWGYWGDYYWTPTFMYYSKGKFQVAPRVSDCNPALAQTPHPGGIQVSMGDSSARSVSPEISPQTYWYACTPSGGEVLGSDW